MLVRRNPHALFPRKSSNALNLAAGIASCTSLGRGRDAQEVEMLSDSDKNKNTEPGLAGEIENIRATLAVAGERISELEAELKLARGTKDITRPRPPTLAEAAEAALRERVLSLPELAKAIDSPSGRVSTVLQGFRQAKKIYNLGTEESPRWTWRVGDAAPPEVLNALVRRLINDQPLTTAELVAATGARPARVSGALVAIQRSGAPVMNLATTSRARWFAPEAALDARLPPKSKRP